MMVWTNNSDRALKIDFAPLDKQVLLRRLTRVPVQTWSYRRDRAVRHIGPTAQDFASAFSVGTDDRHIATVDADGVALAAIQALEGQVAALQREVAFLRKKGKSRREGCNGTVGGGVGNVAGDSAGTYACCATVGGGSSNTASGEVSVVAGGWSNVASGASSTVAGGQGNTASGTHSTVPGGRSNLASAANAFAAGSRAKALHPGSFVWGDSQPADVFSTGSDTVNVRAAGGIWLGTDSSPSTPSTRFLNTSTGGYLSSTGVWTNSSDRALKTDFAPLDKQALLRRLTRVPVQSWSYKRDRALRHIGPTAQDFVRAFSVGQDDTHLATVDVDGVALAAIQALVTRNQALEARVAALEQKGRHR